MRKYFFSILLIGLGCYACHTDNQPPYYEGTFQTVSEIARQQNKGLSEGLYFLSLQRGTSGQYVPEIYFYHGIDP